jgi:hypothetical protein
MLDRTQLMAFCDYVIGDRVVGGREERAEVCTPHSPELRAFIVARLGELTPSGGYTVVAHIGRPTSNTAWYNQAIAFAALLREVADGIYPIPEDKDKE